jgi:uncharacterized protein YbjT (DUF2867 family)
VVTEQRRIVVFGGSGFLGRHVVLRLLDHGFAVRAVSRHPERSRAIFGERNAAIESVRADVNEAASIGAAVAGAFGVVNAVSLYVERGAQTFQSVHVEAAERVAVHAQRAGVERLVHVSGIGADERSGSSYIRSRGLGESAVRRAFPATTVVRPAVMFGPGDAFLSALIGLLRRLPAFPMFGRGDTRIQPAHVDDVAEAIARILAKPAERTHYEFAGPRVYSYEMLLRTIAGQMGFRPTLVPLPFGIWHGLAFAAEMLPSPPVTRNQIELMQVDTVATAGSPGFDVLGIAARSIEDTLPVMLQKH